MYEPILIKFLIWAPFPPHTLPAAEKGKKAQKGVAAYTGLTRVPVNNFCFVNTANESFNLEFPILRPKLVRPSQVPRPTY